MVIISSNRRYWWVGMAVSVVIFAVLYLTVIRPDSNTANQAVQAGLKQSQQVIKQAQQQVSSAAAGGSATNVTRQGQKALDKAAKLTACVTAAGTNTSKIAACQTQFGG